MKKVLIFIISVVLAIGSFATLAACGETYTIKYFIDGVEMENAENSTYKKTFEETALWVPTLDGKTFDGWYTNRDLDGITTKTLASNAVGNREFYGRFISDKYNITYVVDGGETAITGKEETYNYSTSETFMLWRPELPDGYVLNGWFGKDDYTGTRFSQLSPNTIDDKTFYAKVVERSTLTDYHTIEYYIDGEKVEDAVPNDFFVSSSPLQLFIPSYNRQTIGFSGWFTSNTYSGTALTQLPANAKGNKVLYGKFVEPVGYSNDKVKGQDFTLKDLAGKDVSLSEFYGKKPVVLNFWFSTCDPCKREMPDFQKAYEELGDKIEFMMINNKEVNGVVNAFILANSFTFPCYFDSQGSVAGLYRVNSFPVTIILDRWGYQTFRYTGSVAETKLKEEINKAINKA